jgi:hypothetical protein
MRPFLLLVAPVGFALAIACGDGGAPLGGPYGGNGNYTNPTNGSGPVVVGGSPDGGGMMPPPPGDSGTAPPPTDSGTAPPPTDSGGPPPPTDSGSKPVDSAPPPTAPTWTEIYTKYLAAGTPGNCGSFCHSSMGDPSGAYNYLQGRGQISGTSSGLVSTYSSDLSWFGGNMPPGGPGSYPTAAADMQAWAAAGALNN